MSLRNELIIELGKIDINAKYYRKLYGKLYRKGALDTKRGIRLMGIMQECSIRRRRVKSLISVLG